MIGCFLMNASIETKIHLIIGLPGSGKTYYANKHFKNIQIVDDITDLRQLPTAKEFVVTDVNFCDRLTLENARNVLTKLYGEVIFNHIYFENNPDKARKNVERRNDGRYVEGTIRRFAPIYNPPEDALEIWDAD